MQLLKGSEKYTDKELEDLIKAKQNLFTLEYKLTEEIRNNLNALVGVILCDVFPDVKWRTDQTGASYLTPTQAAYRFELMQAIYKVSNGKL